MTVNPVTPPMFSGQNIESLARDFEAGGIDDLELLHDVDGLRHLGSLVSLFLVMQFHTLDPRGLLLSLPESFWEMLFLVSVQC